LYYGRLDKRIVMVTCSEDLWMIDLVHELLGFHQMLATTLSQPEESWAKYFWSRRLL